MDQPPTQTRRGCLCPTRFARPWTPRIRTERARPSRSGLVFNVGFTQPEGAGWIARSGRRADGGIPFHGHAAEGSTLRGHPHMRGAWIAKSGRTRSSSLASRCLTQCRGDRQHRFTRVGCHNPEAAAGPTHNPSRHRDHAGRLAVRVLRSGVGIRRLAARHGSRHPRRDPPFCSLCRSGLHRTHGSGRGWRGPDRLRVALSLARSHGSHMGVRCDGDSRRRSILPLLEHGAHSHAADSELICRRADRLSQRP